MPNEPVDLDDIETDPETQPTIPGIADVMSARARAWVYLLIALASPGYAIYEASSEAPVAVTAIWASVTALGSLLAVANVPRKVT